MAEYLFKEPRYNDPEAARQWLENVRWPDGPVCPHCGAYERISKIQGTSHRPGLYQCLEPECREQFTVTVGTVFERSKISLDKWLFVAAVMAASKKGVSSKQIERMLGVTYKTAWFMTHRLREAMKEGGSILGGNGGTVEADETYIGRKPYRNKRPGWSHKNAVVSLVERGGKVRSIHVPRVNVKNLKPILMDNISKSARLITDEAGVYRPLGSAFEGGHETVNHSRDEYVRGDVFTNTAENFFSIMKRGIYGVFHHVSE